MDFDELSASAHKKSHSVAQRSGWCQKKNYKVSLIGL